MKKGAEEDSNIETSAEEGGDMETGAGEASGGVEPCVSEAGCEAKPGV